MLCRPLVVEGRQNDLVGIAATASEGTTGREQLQWRPLLRPGELLETVPGLIATQHSGTKPINIFYVALISTTALISQLVSITCRSIYQRTVMDRGILMSIS